MEKKIELVIDLIENSIRYELGQVDFTVDGNNIDVFETNHSTFYATCLIASIASIDKVNSYIYYDHDLKKAILRVF